MQITYKVMKQQGSKRWGIYRTMSDTKIPVLVEGGFFNREVAILVAAQYRDFQIRYARRDPRYAKAHNLDVVRKGDL